MTDLRMTFDWSAELALTLTETQPYTRLDRNQASASGSVGVFARIKRLLLVPRLPCCHQNKGAFAKSRPLNFDIFKNITGCGCCVILVILCFGITL